MTWTLAEFVAISDDLNEWSAPLGEARVLVMRQLELAGFRDLDLRLQTYLIRSWVRLRREAQNRAGPSERWVCGACGKHTELGGHRYDLRDSSCVTHAVLCEQFDSRLTKISSLLH